MEPNTLYYGDNLPVLREHFPDECVDLIYLDPPFNSNRSYNVLFKEQSKASSPAQIEAFEDTWHWGPHAEEAFMEVTRGSDNTARLLKSMVDALGRQNDVTAYLCMMAARLIELRRVLKPTGSIYLHCDPTASHYLKVLMDSIFGPEHFRNEIIWKRTMSKGLMTRRLPQSHDVILSYQRSDEGVWNSAAMFSPYDLDNLDEKTDGKYSHTDADGRRFQLDNLINPNPNRPNLTYDFLGVTKVWRWTKERMQAAYDDHFYQYHVPPDTWSAWIGRYVGHFTARYRGQRASLYTPLIPDLASVTPTINGVLGTILIGQFAAQVIGLHWGASQQHFPECLFRVWPILVPEILVWPPRKHIGDAILKTFEERLLTEIER